MSNAMANVDYDGCEFPKPDWPIGIAEFSILVPVVAEMMNFGFEKYDFRMVCHAFTLRLNSNMSAIKAVIEELERSFPPNVKWYEIDGRKLFEIRGPSGGVTTSLACYLKTRL